MIRSSVALPRLPGHDQVLETEQRDHNVKPCFESFMQLRRMRSDDYILPPIPAKSAARAAATTRPLHSAPRAKMRNGATEKTGRMMFEEVKNKPLPRIAALQ